MSEPIAMQHTWQAIETAPKDGTRILICGGIFDNDSAPRDGFYPFDSVTIAFWHVRWGQGHWHGDELSGHDCWNWHEPKYWMPLPLLPIQESGMSDKEKCSYCQGLGFMVENLTEEDSPDYPCPACKKDAEQ